jgi:uncharacterized protein YndB with AHSA1/START domain
MRIRHRARPRRPERGGGPRRHDENVNSAPPIHGTFTLPLDLAVPPARVYAAYCEQDLRTRWFRLPSEPGQGRHERDFRVGGHEIATGVSAASGEAERLEYRSTFLDIVAGERFVFCYEVIVDDLRRWVSLVTVELAPRDGGTRLTHTEQYVLLAYTDDGAHDVGHLRGGTRLQFNGLAAVLASCRCP